jgi:hypothetical protein
MPIRLVIIGLAFAIIGFVLLELSLFPLGAAPLILVGIIFLCIGIIGMWQGT